MSGPNWGKLVKQGRAKAPGIPWSDEEAKAVFEYKIPADYVRRGVLTKEQYSKSIKDESKEIEKNKVKSVDSSQKATVYEDLNWNDLKNLAKERQITAKKKEDILKELREQDSSEKNEFALSKISELSTSKLIEKANDELKDYLEIRLDPAMTRYDIIDRVLIASAKKMSENKKEVDKK